MGHNRFERRGIALAVTLLAALALHGAAWAVEPFKIREILNGMNEKLKKSPEPSLANA